MFGIVSTISVLERVLEGTSKWADIINSSENIYAFEDKPINNDKVFDLSQSGSLIRDPEIKNFPSINILKRYSSCVFLMDIDPQEARRIQEQYGVICQSIAAMDDSILTSVAPDHFELEYGENGYDWKRVLKGLSIPTFPSNCLIINDRYLFTDDDILGEKVPGYDNVVSLLDALLPKKFNENPQGPEYFPYQVLIIYQPDTNSRLTPAEIKERFDKLATKINKIRLRTYHISFELIGLNGANKNSFFQNSHNRRIYSNYFTISCDHQIAAFCRSKSRCSQSIEILKHFSKLDKDGSDQPVKGHNAFVGKLSESISDWMRHVNYEATYRVAKNGNYRLTIHHLENRLVAPNTK
jgi:hypothetical protein